MNKKRQRKSSLIQILNKRRRRKPNLLILLSIQWTYYTQCYPLFSKEIKKRYRQNKFLKNCDRVKDEYWNKYKPLDITKTSSDIEDFQNFQDKNFVNHYRLWNYIGDRTLYLEALLSPNFIKMDYLEKFVLRKDGKLPDNYCYLCEAFGNNHFYCNKIWQPIKINYLKNLEENMPCQSSFLKMTSFFPRYLTKKQQALLCYHIATLSLDEIKSHYYRSNLWNKDN